MKKLQRKSGKSNITIINRKSFYGDTIINTVLIIGSINIFFIDHLDKVLLFMQ